NRQAENSQNAEPHNDDRDNPGEDRAVNEKTSHDQLASRGVASELCSSLSVWTSAPGLAFWNPETTIASPPFNPVVTQRLPSAVTTANSRTAIFPSSTIQMLAAPFA